MLTIAGIDKQQHKPLWPSLLEGPIAIDHPNAPTSEKDEYIDWSN